MRKFFSLLAVAALTFTSFAGAFANSSQGNIDPDPVELTIHGGGTYDQGTAIVMSFINSSGDKVALPNGWSVDVYGLVLFAPPVASTDDGGVQMLNDSRFYIVPDLAVGKYTAFLKSNGTTVDSESFEVNVNFGNFSVDDLVQNNADLELNLAQNGPVLQDVVVPDVGAVDFSAKPSMIDLSKYEYYKGEEVTMYVSGPGVLGNLVATDLGGDYYTLTHGVNGPGGEFLYLSSADGSLSKDGEPLGVYTFDAGNDSTYDFRNVLYNGEEQLSVILYELLELPEAAEFFINMDNAVQTAGESVVANVSMDDGARNVPFSVGSEYDVRLYKRGESTLQLIGDLGDDFFVRDYTQDGKYGFVVPENVGNYSLRLYKGEERLSMWDFEVQAAPEVVLDPDDVVVPPADDNLIPEGNGQGQEDAGGGPVGQGEGPLFVPENNEDVAPEFRCSDLPEGHWVTRMLNALLDENIFPIMMDGDEVICRVDTELTRKVATAWLLKVYRPELVADVDSFDYDYADSPFSDVDGTDAYDPYVIIASQAGIVNGYPDGTFKPENTVNRAEWLKILMRTKELYLDTEAQFTLLSEDYSEMRPAVRYNDVSVNDREQYWYGYLYAASAMYSPEEDTYLIAGRTNGVERNAAMADPVLYGEAAKLVFLTETLNSLFQ